MSDKEQETLYKLHYQQLLTVRSVIENFEKNFSMNLKKKNNSRIDKWKEFLDASDEQFKPFKDAGLSVSKVSGEIDVIFKRHSAEIHSVHLVEGLVLDARGLLSPEQLMIIRIVIQNSPWRGLVSIA